MGIDFGPERWDKVRDSYSLWWERKLERPLVPVILTGKEVGRSKPVGPLLTQATCNDLSIPACDVIDRLDYELSSWTYLGDAFPMVSLDCFGPGVVAAFLGATLSNVTGSVWFHPKQILPIDELHFEYNPDNVWLKRIKALCSEAIKRWQGQVLVGMPDLGGVMDILSTFRPSALLLMDLYDEPDEVKRLTWEIYNLWHRFYDEINEVLQPVNPGYSDWAKVYSDKPTYTPQCDFCYMISPAMFDTFVKPELEATCQRLGHTLYHLDGVGELPHLDSLLTIEELDAVQWVPGDGKPGQENWPEVYKKIQRAGKGIQLWGGFDCLDAVAQQLGTYSGIEHNIIWGSLPEEGEFRRRLDKYGFRNGLPK